VVLLTSVLGNVPMTLAPRPADYLLVPCDTEPCSCRWKIK
jgi:hypothetical protein